MTTEGQEAAFRCEEHHLAHGIITELLNAKKI